VSGPVVFDGAILAAGPITGVGRALLEALRAYAVIATRSIVLLLPDGAKDPDIGGVRCVAGPVGLAARVRRMPQLLRSLGASVLHSPVAALPHRAPCPMIASVHDLPWMADPPLENDDAGGPRHRAAIRHAARHGDAILCVSRTSRHHLVRYLGRRPKARVCVVHNGVATPAEPAPASELTGPLLVLAADRPRKNLDRVRHAHARAREIESDVPGLLIAGPPEAYLPESEKIAALRRSSALLHVTLFEGFGLPVVEAFQHGVPVVCSDRGALPEIAGDAALTVDPMDEEEIARAIVRVTKDADLRAALRHRGLQRARVFTCERTARRWQQIHDEVSA